MKEEQGDGVLKRKKERTANDQGARAGVGQGGIDELRQQADAAGFDLNATLAEGWCAWRSRSGTNSRLEP